LDQVGTHSHADEHGYTDIDADQYTDQHAIANAD
jgi:hypothetical protein